MKGLLAILGKGKPEESSKGGAERTYAKEAFSAVQDGDEEGFIEAFVSAVRACVKKEESSEGYEEPEE